MNPLFARKAGAKADEEAEAARAKWEVAMSEAAMAIAKAKVARAKAEATEAEATEARAKAAWAKFEAKAEHDKEWRQEAKRARSE